MTVLAMMQAAAGSGEEKLYADDVFSAYTYTGNGGTQTITNGIDLAGQGGMVWIKARDNAFNNTLYDTIRGVNNRLRCDQVNASETNADTLTGFNSNGFSLGGGLNAINAANTSFVSWTFRKAAKFFDMGTYTGNGVAGRQIPHSLGVVPGMVIVKETSAIGGYNWVVYHKSLPATSALYLNTTAAEQTGFAGAWNSTTPTNSAFTLGSSPAVNANGATYVWYAFAHDPSADGIIQCGSFTTASPTYKTIVSLGWEPQYLLIKPVSGSGDWSIIDNMRGMPVGGYSSVLWANSSEAENSGSYKPINLNPTGFEVDTSNLRGPGSGDYIYLAIRRPNKPPTTGTQVYNAIARTGTGAAATVDAGFPVDLMIHLWRDAGQHTWFDRLRGNRKTLSSTDTGLENSVYGDGDPQVDFVGQGGNNIIQYPGQDWNNGGRTIGLNLFRRAPGVFDVVCYNGTGSATTMSHSLGVAPELMIVKARSGAYAGNTNWKVYVKPVGAGGELQLNTTSQALVDATWNDSLPTASTFSVAGAGYGVNNSSHTYVAYLFATLPGISKVGSYTGNGSSQTINAGFTTGSRFVLIKRTDSTGDWYVWDTARGIVSANDPHLSLNTTAAEVTTDDSIDPDTSGFIVNQNAATNINIIGGFYIYLAFA